MNVRRGARTVTLMQTALTLDADITVLVRKGLLEMAAPAQVILSAVPYLINCS